MPNLTPKEPSFVPMSEQSVYFHLLNHMFTLQQNPVKFPNVNGLTGQVKFKIENYTF